jgi:hypothetical protein
MIFEDGTGSGYKAGVNARNEVKAFAITETESQAASELGDAYNINTGEETFAASTSSGLLYFKNDEDTDIIVEAIACGFRNSTTTDDQLAVFVVRNPTGGTLYDAATGVDMNENRNFGSSKTLKTTTLAYKSTAQNQTLTGGDDIVLLHASKAGRLFAAINLELPRGSSLGIRVDSASLATTCYAALVMHAKDSNR